MTGSGSYIVRGIQRVAFRANIETTNLFLTGLVFYSLLVVFTIAVIAAFKGYCELAAKKKWMEERYIPRVSQWVAHNSEGNFVPFDPDRLPTDDYPMPLGIHASRLSCRGCVGHFLPGWHDSYPGMGCIQGCSHRTPLGCYAP